MSADKNKVLELSKAPIGTIAVDSIFTPVLKVNYTVENTRVEQITDYDKLTLEVWTDGTISAKEAVVWPPRSSIDSSTTLLNSPMRFRAPKSWRRKRIPEKKRYLR